LARPPSSRVQADQALVDGALVRGWPAKAVAISPLT
jgi:hypothetical protein